MANFYDILNSILHSKKLTVLLTFSNDDNHTTVFRIPIDEKPCNPNTDFILRLPKISEMKQVYNDVFLTFQRRGTRRHRDHR